jgi:hypothetical protein
MIKDLAEQQSNSKNAYFARQLTAALHAKGVEPSPKVVATELNLHCKSNIARPHTVRKWLVGHSKPRSEILLLLTNWLNVDPKQLLRPLQETTHLSKVSFEFDFTDQQVISKYLSMTVKQKVTVQLVIDAISENTR